MPSHIRCKLHQRACQNIGSDEVEGTALGEDWMVEAQRRAGLDPPGCVVQASVFLRYANGDRVDVGRQNRNAGEESKPDGEHAAARAEVEGVVRTLAFKHSFDHLETAGRGAMVTGAEGEAGLDLDRNLAGLGAAPPVGAVNVEAPGAHRAEAFE